MSGFQRFQESSEREEEKAATKRSRASKKLYPGHRSKHSSDWGAPPKEEEEILLGQGACKKEVARTRLGLVVSRATPGMLSVIG